MNLIPTLRKISVAILHDDRRPERAICLEEMMSQLPEAAFSNLINIFNDRKPVDVTWAEFKTVLALKQWEWSLRQEASHHLFLTDDLFLAPNFWGALQAMVDANPDKIIGLLSNHPESVKRFEKGDHAYRCNSWIVGPAYLVPKALLKEFVAWYKALPDTEEVQGRRWFNDDSALNEWNTTRGPGASWHPIPTIIEHRNDIASTVGHGDRFSCQRVSWRQVTEPYDSDFGLRWSKTAVSIDLAGLEDPHYWRCEGEMLSVTP